MKSEINQASAKKAELKSALTFETKRTDNVAIFIANAFGSMTFLIVCTVFLAGWICWNTNILPGLKPFDPFPFPTLEMAVSIFAIILSISVLINQNRQGRIEKIRQQVEFEINVQAESEITKILSMLHDIHQKLGLKDIEDQELEKMKEPTDLSQIHQTVDNQQAGTKNDAI